MAGLGLFSLNLLHREFPPRENMGPPITDTSPGSSVASCKPPFARLRLRKNIPTRVGLSWYSIPIRSMTIPVTIYDHLGVQGLNYIF